MGNADADAAAVSSKSRGSHLIGESKITALKSAPLGGADTTTVSLLREMLPAPLPLPVVLLVLLLLLVVMGGGAMTGRSVWLANVSRMGTPMSGTTAPNESRFANVIAPVPSKASAQKADTISAALLMALIVVAAVDPGLRPRFGCRGGAVAAAVEVEVEVVADDVVELGVAPVDAVLVCVVGAATGGSGSTLNSSSASVVVAVCVKSMSGSSMTTTSTFPLKKARGQ